MNRNHCTFTDIVMDERHANGLLSVTFGYSTMANRFDVRALRFCI